ncbi:toll/interleukin-1 receptor domain-containing protein [Nocardia sp. NPDC006044]|uniref:toll/interleukin-1 receptor domain-containing protein n=1 Tax=Nocardia sp. NPDC006044 TaxID=3364306 RepID=UPI0036894F96
MLNDDQRAPGEHQPGYDAFISYRSAVSAKAARQLQRALIALSKRHRTDGGVISLFLDTQSLVAGELDAEIKRALEHSRSLIVLLGAGTNESPWVNIEIEHWLGHGGDKSRLYLVRHDESVNLTWADGKFAEPEALPAALADLFDTERKWLELRTSLTGTDETALVGLYAPIAGIRPEDLLLAEADFQQQRQRRTRMVLSALSILLVLSLVAGVVALFNWRSSEANRVRADREAVQARAEANAAQALLATEDSAALGIRLGVEAADASSSASVRAALLAVADSTSVLEHAFEFPRGDAGYPGTGVAFSIDDAQLFAWGHAADRPESYLVGWDLETGRRQFGIRVSIPALSAVAAVAPRWVAGCSDAGPVVIGTATNEVRKLAADWQRSSRCTVHAFGGGLAIVTRESSGRQGTSYFLNHAGAVTELAGMSSIAVRQDAPVAIVAGPGGIAALRAGGVLPVSNQPASTADILDNAGGFAVRADQRRWVLGRPQGESYSLTETSASQEAVDSAPELTLEGLTGALAEVTADGTVRMTGSTVSGQVASDGRLDKFNHATEIESVTDGFVVVYRDAAFMAWAPGQRADPSLVKFLPRDTWRVLHAGWSMAAAETGQTAVVGACANRDKIYLRDDSKPSTVWTVSAGLATKVEGFIGTGPTCGVATASGGIRFKPKYHFMDSNLTLRKNPAFDAVAIGATETKIAVIQADLPIEVLTTGGEANRPWGARQMPNAEVSTALGERRIVLGGDVATVLRDGSVRRWRGAVPERVLAVHPAGLEVLSVNRKPGSRAVFVTEAGLAGEADIVCAATPVGYVPNPGFQTSKQAATQALLVADTGRGVIDCHTGRLIDALAPNRIVDYGITERGGQILWRDEKDRLQITDWSTVGTGVRTRPAPDDLSRPGAHVFTAGTTIAGIADGEGLLRIFRADGDGWQQVSTVPMTLRNPVGIALADKGTLAVVVAGDAGFEIFDTATGRRLVTGHPDLLAPDLPHHISVTESDGFLTILVYRKDDAAAKVGIEVPITVPLLVGQLCTAYSAPLCGRHGN